MLTLSAFTGSKSSHSFIQHIWIKAQGGIMLANSLSGQMEEISLTLCLYLRYDSSAKRLYAAMSWFLQTSPNTLAGL